MGERSKNLARSRKRAAQIPVTLLERTHESCKGGLHLWCPGVVVRGKRSNDCLCGCHAGRKVLAPEVGS